MEIRIALFSEKEQAETLDRLMHRVLLSGQYDYRLFHFLTPRAFEAGLDGMHFDIAVISGQPGIPFGILYRQKNRGGVVIYLSENREGVWQALRSMPMAFVTDIRNTRAVASALLDAAAWVNSDSEVFHYTTREGSFAVPYSHIDYFESRYHNVLVHQNDDEPDIRLSAKLDDLSQSLPKRLFARCHQSYCVNMANIRRVDKAEKRVYFGSGAMVFISRSCYGDFIRRFEGALPDGNGIASGMPETAASAD